MKTSLIAGLLVVTAALAACSNGGGTTPSTAPEGSGAEAYVTTLCTSLTDWLNAVEAGSQAKAAGASLQAQKDQVLDFLDQVIGATETWISELNAQGAPDVDDGAAIHVALTGRLASVLDGLEAAYQSVEDLSTKNKAGFETGIIAAQAQVQAAGQNISTALDGLSSSALDQAAAQTPECVSLVTSAGSPGPPAGMPSVPPAQPAAASASPAASPAA